MTITQHPAFRRLIELERARDEMRRRPGGRDALRANSMQCMAAEQEIMRDTGCTFMQLATCVLAEV